MLCRADDEILKITKRIFTQHVTLVAWDVPSYRGLARKDVKMILPKINHHFLQLTLGINGTQHTVCDDRRQDLICRFEIVFGVKLGDLLPAFTLLSLGLFALCLISVCLIITAPFKLLQQRTRIWIFCKKLGRREVKDLKVFNL